MALQFFSETVTYSGPTAEQIAEHKANKAALKAKTSSSVKARRPRRSRSAEPLQFFVENIRYASKG